MEIQPINKSFDLMQQQPHLIDYALTFTLAVVVRGTWPVAFPYSRFSCAAWVPIRAEKAVARWRRSKVFCGGIFNSRAKVSELKRGSRIYERAFRQQMAWTNLDFLACNVKKNSKCTVLTISPPWTPLPRRLGAYSARSTALSHSITRWLDHCTTSEGDGCL